MAAFGFGGGDAEDMDWGDGFDDPPPDPRPPEKFEEKKEKSEGKSASGTKKNVPPNQIKDNIPTESIEDLLQKRDDVKKGANDIASKATLLKPSKATENGEESSSTTDSKSKAWKGVFRPFYIVFEREKDKKKKTGPTKDDLKRIHNLKKSDASEDAKGEDWAGEKYEGTPEADKPFRKFVKRIKRHPEQVLRYQFGGEPLFMSANRPRSIPKCACGAKREFELQIMPALLSVIEPTPKLEWGTLSLYVCPTPCSIEKFCREHIYIEPVL
uniref:Programmed cell death protein 2 C-terminal domain-containing protein n=1 Tax=Amorphochlora amoebiformis TaxID=1561963 RepID=A0A7S0D049_9EUKA|mmetsp:Transcript_16863/g.26787  ORF Transcript_16863/g.26787 Transcript_16863/m.26787 type:complete len:270 (+) Transcript_16863:1-810(+)